MTDWVVRGDLPVFSLPYGAKFTTKTTNATINGSSNLVACKRLDDTTSIYVTF